LPDDLLRQAARRLETMALIGAVLWLLATLLGHLAFHITNPGDPRWAQLQTSDGVAAASTAVSLALFFYLRTDSRDPARVVDLGLVYMVIMAFAIGVVIWLIGRNVAALAHKPADPNSRLCCLEGHPAPRQHRFAVAPLLGSMVTDRADWRLDVPVRPA